MMSSILTVFIFKVYLIVSEISSTTKAREIFHNAVVVRKRLLTTVETWSSTKAVLTWSAVFGYRLRSRIVSAMSHRWLSSDLRYLDILIWYCCIFDIQFDLKHLTSRCWISPLLFPFRIIYNVISDLSWRYACSLTW